MSEPDDIWDRKKDLVPFGDARERDATPEELEALSQNLRFALQSPIKRITAWALAIIPSEDPDTPIDELARRRAAEKSDVRLAREILGAAKGLAAAQAASDIQTTTFAAFWIGELAERARWHFRNVEGLAASPAELTRERKKARRPFAHKNEGRDTANAKRAQERLARAHHALELAADLGQRRTNPSVSELADYARKNWREGEAPSLRIIRSYISGK